MCQISAQLVEAFSIRMVLGDWFITELVERPRSIALACTHALMLERMNNNYACAHAHRHAQSVRQEHYAKPDWTVGGDAR